MICTPWALAEAHTCELCVPFNCGTWAVKLKFAFKKNVIIFFNGPLYPRKA